MTRIPNLPVATTIAGIDAFVVSQGNVTKQMAVTVMDDYFATGVGAAGSLLAANNLSDVSSSGAALTNLGLSAFGQSLIAGASASTVKTLLGLGSAYDAYAAGTTYSLTITSTALTFGTTQPSITIGDAGVYRIFGRVNLKLNGATFAANRTITLKFRRTNNTAADLTSGSTAILSGIETGLTGTLGIINLPDLRYTASAGDIITIFGDVSVAPTAGSLDAIEADIHAERVG